MAKKFVYHYNCIIYLYMYEINIDMPNDHDKEEAKELLSIMVDVLETINDVDDVPTFNVKMKLVNNIDFIIDNIMQKYIDGK